MTESSTAQGRPAGLKNVTYPTCTVAGEPVDTGNEARCFAQYMNIHALEATGGFTYSQMGIYSAKPGTPKSQLEPGGGTSNPQYAQTDPKTGQPVQNASRNVWVTETALSTALNVSYMATQLSLFSLVVGIALLLAGVGFIVLALGGGLKRGVAETLGTGRRPPALVRRFRVVLDGAAHFACLVGCAEATYEVQGHVDAR